MSRLSAELPGKRLERRTATGPQRRRVAGLANPAAVSSTLYRHNLTVAAQALGLPLHVGELRRPDALDAACAAITRAGAAALIVRADPALLALLHGRLADLAATRRLPAMYDWGEYGAAGGLMSEAPSLSDVYRRAAIYGDKIRKGTKPADLPVAQPTKCELVLNRTTAKALGCTCPPAILFQADEVSRSRPPRSSCSSPSAFSRPPSPLQRSHRARAPGAAPWRRFPHPPLCGRRSWTGCGSAGRAQGGTSSSSAGSRTATRSASRRSPPSWSSSGSIASLRSQHPPLSPPRTRPRRCRSACRRRSIPWAQGERLSNATHWFSQEETVSQRAARLLRLYPCAEEALLSLARPHWSPDGRPLWPTKARRPHPLPRTCPLCIPLPQALLWALRSMGSVGRQTARANRSSHLVPFPVIGIVSPTG